MSKIYNIYCDESCHLENDHQGVMALGAAWCPKEAAREIAEQIRAIKTRHGMHPNQEIKWGKVSANKTRFYLDIIDYFFSCPDLHFRCVLVQDKDKLAHDKYNQTHDQWYYKMYFVMLQQILSPQEQYNIYIDIKDTQGGRKIRKLHEVLCNSMFDFSKSVIHDVQQVCSHQVQQVQLADMLIGAVSYLNRDLSGNAAKLAVIKRIKALSGYNLRQTTLLREDKFNILRWSPSGGDDNV